MEHRERRLGAHRLPEADLHRTVAAAARPRARGDPGRRRQRGRDERARRHPTAGRRARRRSSRAPTTVEPGSAFAGWTGACAGQDGTCDLAITDDLATGATFEPALTLDVTRAGAGAGKVTSEPAGIDCGDSCSAGFAPGETVTLTSDPDVASTFEGWSGSCTGTGPCIVEMTQARSVSATFGQGSGCGSILFTRARGGNDEVYVIRPDGSAVTRLTNHSATDKDPPWSPDCRKIAFSSSRSGNPEIWVMDADGGEPTRLTTATGADTDPAWSPDGSQIAFVSGRIGNSEIYTMTPPGPARRTARPTRPTIGHPTGRPTAPRPRSPTTRRATSRSSGCRPTAEAPPHASRTDWASVTRPPSHQTVRASRSRAREAGRREGLDDPPRRIDARDA